MKKRTVLAALLISLAMLLIILACIPSMPAGIGYIGEDAFYTIRMTADERESYFTVIEEAGSAAVSNYGQSGIRAISWYYVKGGGYIAWVGNVVRYVPANVKDEHRAFASLTSDSSTMSIKEAKAYVPQLADKD